MTWRNLGELPPIRYTCGYCGNLVGPNKGYVNERQNSVRIYICSHCAKPTYFEDGHNQTPGAIFGSEIKYLPESLGTLYQETRKCMSISAYTSAVLTCRKMLMNIAVEQGAEEGLRFIAYVDYLANTGYVPPNGRNWVDHIRKKGNEATHEIVVMSRVDAEDLVTFIEMLLRFIYEFPGRISEGQDD